VPLYALPKPVLLKSLLASGVTGSRQGDWRLPPPMSPKPMSPWYHRFRTLLTAVRVGRPYYAVTGFADQIGSVSAIVPRELSNHDHMNAEGAVDDRTPDDETALRKRLPAHTKNLVLLVQMVTWFVTSLSPA